MEPNGGMFTNSCGLKVLFLPMILLTTTEIVMPMLISGLAIAITVAIFVEWTLFGFLIPTIRGSL
jgi:hypothetical protein